MPPYQPHGAVEPPEPSRRTGRATGYQSGNRWSQGYQFLTNDRLQWLEILLD